MNLAGKKVLVTGAAKRVGRAIALEFAGAGCDVAIHYHKSRDEAKGVLEEVRGLGAGGVIIAADLNDQKSWPRLIEEAVASLGGLHVLVNNASRFVADASKKGSGTIDPAEWERTMRVNAYAPVALAQCAAPHLAKEGGGAVVNLTDISAEKPWRKHVAYCASKAALNSATRSLAKQLGPHVRVNAVAPGIAVFPDDYDEETRQRLIDRVPLARAGTPEEVAKLVRFLGEDADYMTGQIIAIDGGRSIVF